MIRPFIYCGGAARIVFGAGSSASVGEWVERIGCRRALLLSTPRRVGDAEAMAARLGSLAAGVFGGAAMHTPVAVTEAAVLQASALGADCVVSLGGGSTTGLGKAIAWRTDLPQIAVPTTYAGSEVTPILGQTENGVKTTLRDPRVLPEVVLYDPDLTHGLPVAASVASGLNALAHAAEGLYAEDRNPIASLMAAEGIRALVQALPAVVASPRDPAARETALYGAWLCGAVLGQVAMSLHHKICHVLGGSFEMPHAETHAVMLPHTVGYNAGAALDLLRPLAETLGAAPGPALHDFAGSIGAPRSLRELGLGEADLNRAAEIATQNAYSNPRLFDRAAIRALLQDAWEGARPPG